jgi:hypothetical protein
MILSLFQSLAYFARDDYQNSNDFDKKSMKITNITDINCYKNKIKGPLREMLMEFADVHVKQTVKECFISE